MTEVLLENVSKAYTLSGAAPQFALKDVSADVKDGEFVCLLGPSGCGKTTLLNILSGLDRDYQGKVSFRGGAGLAQDRPAISYMFQEPRLLPWLDVESNLRFVLDHVPRDDRRVQQWLERVGLAGYGRHYPLQLSLGMQQRVAVARALILEPELLLMDEPFSSLDELTAARMRAELLKLWREQSCTVVFVTHNPLEAVYLADRILVMSPGPGRIVAEVEVGKLLPRPRDLESQRLWELSRQVVRYFSEDRLEQSF